MAEGNLPKEHLSKGLGIKYTALTAKLRSNISIKAIKLLKNHFKVDCRNLFKLTKLA